MTKIEHQGKIFFLFYLEIIADSQEIAKKCIGRFSVHWNEVFE
jgi:hypothetical protein